MKAIRPKILFGLFTALFAGGVFMRTGSANSHLTPTTDREELFWTIAFPSR